MQERTPRDCEYHFADVHTTYSTRGETLGMVCRPFPAGYIPGIEKTQNLLLTSYPRMQSYKIEETGRWSAPETKYRGREGGGSEKPERSLGVFHDYMRSLNYCFPHCFFGYFFGFRDIFFLQLLYE